jgi:hypothetical protein
MAIDNMNMAHFIYSYHAGDTYHETTNHVSVATWQFLLQMIDYVVKITSS